MAMQIVTKSSAHEKTGSSGSIPYALPASPTLTNPDMILPDYDETASTDRSNSPMMMWNNGQFDLNGQSYHMGPITPVTPIIYGNGTMLSDIGEVTEAESTVGPARSSMAPRSGHHQSNFTAKQSSSMAAYEALKKKKSEPRILARERERERRLSMESTSTVTNGDNPGVFADFDDTVSVGDSNFQGDDEESVAESYIFEDTAAGGDTTPPAREFARSLGAEAEERYSTALSRRAEQILANAKRRLTTMEGNLHRARSSLSIDSGSEPSPPYSRPSTAIHRSHDSGFSKSHHGHTRISSENNIPIDFKPATLSPRSSSALGVTGSYRQLLLSSRSVDFKRDSPPNLSPKTNPIYGNVAASKSKNSLHDSKYTLDPLSEDEAMKSANPPQQPGLEDAKLATFLSPTFGSFDEKGLRRSASTAQMRDIKDHMAELKGRLSSLREQARADGMKRRSMQSLRTPSPFTAAPDFGSESKTEYAIGKSMTDISRWNDGVESLHESDISVKGDQELTDIEDNASIISGSIYSDQEGLSPRTRLSSADHSPSKTSPAYVTPNNGEIWEGDADDMDDMKTEDGYEDEEEEEFEVQDGMSESGESDYHDSVQNQVSHEDREDAFDYEHFFLHSAMGSMSQKKLRRSNSQASFSSEDSVETTRGPMTNGDRQRSRRGSNASLSSLDSFLTATEGRTTRVDQNVTEYFPEHLVEQTITIPARARSHTPDTARRATFGLGRSDSNSDQSQPRASNIRRPQSSAAAFMHRPSVSSIHSSGTNRSFPLVNRPRNGMLTPRESPDEGLRKISETLMSETASICESAHGDEKPIEMLQRDDQILVERLVASLGKCILGLTEHGRASTESRAFRRRIESARRILEGLDQPM